MKKLLKGLLVLIVIGIIVVVGGLLTMPSRSYNAAQFANDRNDGKSIERGNYIAIAGDCLACHQSQDHKADFSGGYGIETPFGMLYASNITSDKQTGIGDWTEEQFADAVRNGKGSHGPLYPAMPYTAYVKMNNQDIHDLWNYMKTVEPVNNKVVENKLPFPFNIRYLMFGWKRLFFDASSIKEDDKQSAEWNRGRYLVEGAAHCSVCHTPRNFFGVEVNSKAYTGAVLQTWYAPSLKGNSVEGLGDWSEEALVQYLKTGSNHITVASGPMAEAVEASFQHMTDQDLKAIAVYVKSFADHHVIKPQALAGDNIQMVQGKKIYLDNCTACHLSNGQGVAHMISSFKGNAGIQAASTQSMTHVLLVGSQGAITQFNPTGASMPSFAWKLNDAEAASVLTYIRNAWGNAAPAVSSDEVFKIRKELGAAKPLWKE